MGVCTHVCVLYFCHAPVHLCWFVREACVFVFGSFIFFLLFNYSSPYKWFVPGCFVPSQRSFLLFLWSTLLKIPCNYCNRSNSNGCSFLRYLKSVFMNWLLCFFMNLLVCISAIWASVYTFLYASEKFFHSYLITSWTVPIQSASKACCHMYVCMYSMFVFKLAKCFVCTWMLDNPQ